MLNRYVCDKMFDISVLSRCSLIYDTLLERPFRKAVNGACFIFVRCIPAKIIAFKNVSHDLQRTERVGLIKIRTFLKKERFLWQNKEFV